jgi:hypothetical protein
MCRKKQVKLLFFLRAVVTVHAPRPDYDAFQHVPNQTTERVNEGAECVQAS